MPLELGTYTSNKSKPLSVSTETERIGLFPMPIALINREIVASHRLSTLAVRLFHGLLFLSWNMLQDTKESLLQCGAQALRDLVGRPCQTSSADLDEAFALLQATPYTIPSRHDPTSRIITTILQWHAHQQQGREVTYRWQFGPAVTDWCRGVDTTYAWLDVRQSNCLKTVAALRLYELSSVLVGRTRKPWMRESIANLRTFLEVGNRYHGDWALEHRLLRPSIDSVARVAGLVVTHEKETVANMRVPNVWKLTVARGVAAPAVRQVRARPISQDDLWYTARCECKRGDDLLLGEDTTWS